MKKEIIIFGIIVIFTVGMATVSALDPPTITNICHFPTDDVSDDYVSKEITSDDSVIILATVYTYGVSNPPDMVQVYYNDGSEHSLEMTYNWTYFCYTSEIGKFNSGTTVTYYVEATDTESQTTTSDTYSFTVDDSEPADPNEPPTISINSPTNQSTINDATPTIKASYSDPDGIDTDSVTLTVDDTIVKPIITATSVTYTPTVNMTYGIHNVNLEVSDTLGETSTREWSFTIEEIPSIPGQEENGEKTPGFEMLWIIFALVIFIFWKQKK